MHSADILGQLHSCCRRYHRLPEQCGHSFSTEVANVVIVIIQSIVQGEDRGKNAFVTRGIPLEVRVVVK